MFPSNSQKLTDKEKTNDTTLLTINIDHNCARNICAKCQLPFARARLSFPDTDFAARLVLYIFGILLIGS